MISIIFLTNLILISIFYEYHIFSVMLGMRPDIFPGGTPPGFPHPLGFPHHHPHLAPHHPHLGVGLGVGHGKRKKSWTRAVFSHLQRKGLEKRFTIQKYITKPDRRLLAASLGLTDAQVRIIIRYTPYLNI